MIKLKIGEVLLDQGIISKEQLDQSLAVQRQNGGLLGEILVKNNVISEEQLTKALSRQFGLPFASRTNGLLVVSNKVKMKEIIPHEFARSHHLVPLFSRDETLGVAVADPLDVITMDNLRILTGKNLMAYLAMKSEINGMIEGLYGNGTMDIEKAAKAATTETQNQQAQVEIVEERADLDEAAGDAQEAKVVQLVNQIIRQAIEERASDIHIEPMEDLVSLRFRIDGILHEKSPPSKILSSPMVSRIKILSKLNVTERRMPQDGSFVVKHRDSMVDLRISTCPTVHGEKVVMRILNKQAVKLDVNSLGMEPKQKEDFLKGANYPHGLILLTGPTGSGKTTTLYSILTAIQSTDINIMTIEDPVEFKIRGINQVQVKPQIGLTFATALRSFLRQDPDVILVGEVRDAETSELCMRAAMTGHLVLSTLHTNDALSSVLRLKDLGAEPFILSDTLVLLASQRLVRVLCENCRESYKPEPGKLQSFGFSAVDKLFRPKGCGMCGETGYVGRKAIYEVILVNEKLKIAVQQGAALPELRKIVLESGFMTMRESGFLKVQKGFTSLEEFLSIIMIE